MSKVVVVNFLSLDGVMQSVLFADEDRDGGFERGGWVSPYIDETVGRVMSVTTVRAGGMLLGRRTYEIFAAIWPHADASEPAVAAMNTMPKYVASRTLRPGDGDWANTVVLGADLPAQVSALKAQPGADLVVFGSGGLIQTLIAHDLIDEYVLLTFPLVLGSGKRLFPAGGVPAELSLIDTTVSKSGVVIATYRPGKAGFGA